jgi:phosphatidate cytidylyltransferase
MSTISLNNFWSRTFTGAVFVIAIIGSVMISHWVFSVLFLFTALLSLREFYLLINKSGAGNIHIIPGLIAGAIFYISIVLNGIGLLGEEMLLLNLLLPVLIFILELYRNTDAPLSNIGFTILGFIYIIAPFALLNLFYNPHTPGENYDPTLLLGFFIMMWSYDTFAYLSGRAFGKHPLFPRVSPKKTWEGALGGFILSMGAAWLLSVFYQPPGLWSWITLGAIIVVFGTFGDLAESMFKRSLNIKDSGNLLPGHGGLLDRFDAVLFAAPAVYIYLIIT